MACGGCAGAKSQPLAIVAACFSQPTQLGGVLHGFRGNGARLRALVRRGADRFGELGLDQGLADGFGGLADAVADIGDLECVQGFEQGRLVQGHRVVPLYRFLGGFLQRLTRWPDQRDQARREDQDLHHSRGRDLRAASRHKSRMHRFWHISLLLARIRSDANTRQSAV